MQGELSEVCTFWASAGAEACRFVRVADSFDFFPAQAQKPQGCPSNPSFILCGYQGVGWERRQPKVHFSHL